MYKYGCLIKDNYFVAEVITWDETTTQLLPIDDNPEPITLAEDEEIVYVDRPTMRYDASYTDGYIKPMWDSEAWTEGATEEEIAEWEAEHPAPEAHEEAPTQLDRIEAQVAWTALCTDTLLIDEDEEWDDEPFDDGEYVNEGPGVESEDDDV